MKVRSTQETRLWLTPAVIMLAAILVVLLGTTVLIAQEAPSDVEDLSQRYVVFLGGINSSSDEDSPIKGDFDDIQRALDETLGIKRFIYFSYNAATHGTVYCLGWGTDNCTLFNESNPDESVTIVDLFDSPVYTRADTRQSIITQAKVLEWLIGQIVKRDPSAEIDIVGFSLGGVISSYWASDQGVRSKYYDHIHSLVLINSPVGGIPLAGAILDEDCNDKWQCRLWSGLLADGIPDDVKVVTPMFGRVVLRELQLPIDDPDNSIVSFLPNAARNVFPLTSIQSTADYLVNGEGVPLCSNIACTVSDVALVGSGVQHWTSPPNFKEDELGGRGIATSSVPVIRVSWLLIDNHNSALVHPKTQQWVIEAVRGDFVANTPTQTPTPTLRPSPTRTPTPRPTNTPTPRPSGATANRNANLRGGPGINYPKVGGVTQGQSLEIVGRNADGSWYFLASGVWIAEFLVDNAPENLPVTALPTPQIPTATPTLLPVQETGAAEDDVPEDVARSANAGFELRGRLPYDGDGFSIDYDYINSNFIVYVEPPHVENKEKFDKWLVENGYDVITEPFIFESVEDTAPDATISFYADSTTLIPGECTTLRWDVDNVSEIYLDRQGVVGHDSRQVCPAVSQTYSLTIVHQDGGQEERSVTIQVAQAAPAAPQNGSGRITAGWVLPEDGWTIATRTVPLAVAPADLQSEISRIAISAKWGGNWYGIITLSSDNPVYDWDWCSSGVPDGDVELGLETWDSSGNHFVYSEHHPNFHITKNYDCSPSGLERDCMPIDWNTSSLTPMNGALLPYGSPVILHYGPNHHAFRYDVELSGPYGTVTTGWTGENEWDFGKLDPGHYSWRIDLRVMKDDLPETWCSYSWSPSLTFEIVASENSESACPRKAQGDATCDGLIDTADFELLRQAFNDPSAPLDADFNGDGVVDEADFEILKANFGQ